ncbi:MAG: hypothetical protein H0X29_02235 [Parachlamydiaceae bacterium]|nr:hypothetical protein [Parachlamydiaceae bacterium]
MYIYIPPIQDVYPNKWRLAECMSARSPIFKEVLENIKELSPSRFETIFKESVPKDVQFSVETQEKIRQNILNKLKKDLKKRLAYEVYLLAIEGFVDEQFAPALTENPLKKGKILKIIERGQIQKRIKYNEIELKKRFMLSVNFPADFFKLNIIDALKEIAVNESKEE